MLTHTNIPARAFLGALASFLLLQSGCGSDGIFQEYGYPGGLPSFWAWGSLLGETFYFEDSGTILYTTGAHSFARTFLPARCRLGDPFEQNFSLPSLSPDGRTLAVYRHLSKPNGRSWNDTFCASNIGPTISVELILVDTRSRHVTVAFDSRREKIEVPLPYSVLSTFGSIYGERDKFAEEIFPDWSEDGDSVRFRFAGQNYAYSISSEALQKTKRVQRNPLHTDMCSFAASHDCKTRAQCPKELLPCFSSSSGRFQFFKLKREGVGTVVYLLGYDTLTGESFNHTVYHRAIYME